MLNAIWAGFLILAGAAALLRGLTGDAGAWNACVQSVFASSRLAFETALGLTGVMAFWMGILKVAEASGLLAGLTRCLAPLFRRLFPGVPQEHPALAAMTMNMAANMLGLDNAATPMGLKAMRELQSLNPSADTASNAQALFMVLNTASLTLFPVSILALRAQMGAHAPADVYVPILLSTMASFLAGLMVTSAVQRINLFDRVVLLYAGGLAVLMALLVGWFARLPPAEMLRQSALLTNGLLLLLIVGFVAAGLARRVNVYEAFVEGAKESFQVSLSIFPYLLAMLVAIGLLRASGAMEAVLDVLRHLAQRAGLDSRIVDAMPTALMKPLSGSGARAMMVETMRHFGADSLPGRMASVVQGSTETTFYVLAVYFGAAGIRRVRHALPCALLADLAGLATAVAVSLYFFGR